MRKALGLGSVGFLMIAALLAFGTGLWVEMSLPMLLAFVVYAAFAAFVHELLVGIAAMHSGCSGVCRGTDQLDYRYSDRFSAAGALRTERVYRRHRPGICRYGL